MEYKDENENYIIIINELYFNNYNYYCNYNLFII